MKTRGVLVLMFLVLLGGCGGGDGAASDEDQVRDTVETLVDGFKASDPDKVCDIVLGAALDDIESDGKPCAEAIASTPQDDSYPDIEVREVTVKGSMATAMIQAGSDDPVKWGFIKSNDKWKVVNTDLGG